MRWERWLCKYLLIRHAWHTTVHGVEDGEHFQNEQAEVVTRHTTQEHQTNIANTDANSSYRSGGNVGVL